jgi:hypothetical protein
MNVSLKPIVELAYQTFEVELEGIKATISSGDVLIPFEADLIINPYDCKEKIYYGFFNLYDGVEFRKFNEKKVKFKVGPVEDHEFFYLITLYYYVSWLKEHDLLLSKEFVIRHYFLDDPFKKVIAEKLSR